MPTLSTYLHGILGSAILIPGLLAPGLLSPAYHNQPFSIKNHPISRPPETNFTDQRSDHRIDINPQPNSTNTRFIPLLDPFALPILPPCYPGNVGLSTAFKTGSLSPQQSQLIAGADIWTLVKTEIRPKLSVWEFEFPPIWFTPENMKGDHFIRLDFECTTGRALTEILTREELGVTMVYSQEGFQNIYIRDHAGIEFPVQFIGTWWLAATIDQGRTGLTLHFLDLAPMLITP